MSDWKALAMSEAHANGVATDIVLATVEAETGGRNITGDSGNALGYGQVWSKWHMDAFQKAGAELGLTVPTNNLSNLTSLVLGNDQYSMRVAVRVIKNVWSSVNGNWVAFTKKYVGPAIPDSDLQRRQKIWYKYHNSDFDYAGTPEFTNASTASDIQIPSTNYEVVSDSTQSKNLLYGRKYRIIVSLDGETALDVSDLRCTFKCIKNALMAPNYSEVVIYNLTAKSENAIIKEGSRIIIEAGYEGDQYGIVFDGNVLQPIREKEDGNTYKLTLISIDGDAFYNGSFISSSLIRGQTSRNVIDALTTKRPSVTVEPNFISDSLSNAKLTRGKVLFGLSRDYLRQVAKSENATFYLDNGKVNIVKATDFNKNEIIDLNATSGLIGIPNQSGNGIAGKCLLNPRIKLNTLIHIDNSLVRAQQASQTAQYSLDSDGIYRVIQITYIGDTRGNDWYTEFETVSQAGNIPSMLTNASGSLW